MEPPTTTQTPATAAAAATIPDDGDTPTFSDDSTSSSSSSSSSGPSPSSPQESKESEPQPPTTSDSSTCRTYDPRRVTTAEQLEILNILVHPLWIFDPFDRRVRWANVAALELWNATSLEELLARDLSDMSEASVKRCEEVLLQVAQGRILTEQWTLYPKGQPKTLQIHASGTRLSHSDTHLSLICEGIPLLTNEKLVHENLRCSEMLRHLPMAVCQFDMDGNVMFQNPEACLMVQEEEEEEKEEQQQDNNSEESSSNEATKQDNQQSHINNSNNNSTVKKQQAGNFVSRFVHAQVGRDVWRDIQTNASVDCEALLHTQMGSARWSALRLRQSKDPVTGGPCILYSAQDKSDAVQAQKERKARIQKAEFLAIMAHEIRTPLHQIGGFIDLLDQTCLDAEQRSFVKLLQSSAQGLMTVINDVLDYSKLEAGKMKFECIAYEPLMVTEGSLEAVRTMCEEKQLYLKIQWHKDIPFRILGDPNRLRQVLLNLLSNAVKFTKRGGICVAAQLVTVDTTTTCGKEEEKEHCGDKDRDNPAHHCNNYNYKHTNHNNTKNIASNHQNGKTSTATTGAACQNSNNHRSTTATYTKMVQFTVTDTGMGVGHEHKDTIFQQYQQANLSVARNFGGTGLGLSICQYLVQNMGGSIGVESELGKGASFWFTLPVKEPPEEKSSFSTNDDDDDDDDTTGKAQSETTTNTTAETKQDTYIGLNILVVEDNKVNQKLVANMLKRMGHRSTLAENGKVALDLIVKDDFDLVLMDIQMPIMDGFETTRRLRTMGYTDLPIYGLTASVSRSDFTELGFNDWLPKPILMKDLKAKLHQLQKQQQQASSSMATIQEGQ